MVFKRAWPGSRGLLGCWENERTAAEELDRNEKQQLPSWSILDVLFYRGLPYIGWQTRQSWSWNSPANLGFQGMRGWNQELFVVCQTHWLAVFCYILSASEILFAYHEPIVPASNGYGDASASRWICNSVWLLVQEPWNYWQRRVYLHFVISRNFSGIGSGMSPSLSLSLACMCIVLHFHKPHTHTSQFPWRSGVLRRQVVWCVEQYRRWEMFLCWVSR